MCFMRLVLHLLTATVRAIRAPVGVKQTVPWLSPSPQAETDESMLEIDGRFLEVRVAASAEGVPTHPCRMLGH